MTRPAPSVLRAWAGQLVLAGLAGAVYAWTLLPGVGYHGDTANLQFVGYVFGTTHPTGYPLYTLLNGAFLHGLPVGSLAFRANLLSAVFGVLAVLVLHRLCLALLDDRLAAFVGAGVFAFTPVFWSQCLVAEVYSLHALLMAGVLYLAVRWTRTRRRGVLAAAGALALLSLAHHLTALMILPALAFLVLAVEPRAARDPRVAGAALAAAGLAAASYGYLFWRTRDPATPYLEMTVPSLERLLWYLRGAHFQDRMGAFTLRQVLAERLPLFARLAWAQFGPLLLVALPGAAALGGWRLTGFFLLYVAVNTGWALTYDIPDIAVYFIPSFLVGAVCLAAGLAWLRRRTPERFRRAWLLAALVPVGLIARHAESVSQRQAVNTERQIRAALEAAGGPALILSPDYDYSEYFWYFLIGEGLERERGLYLMHHFHAGQVRDYLRDGAPLYLPTERKTAPPGLPVFFFLPDGGQARHLGRHRMGQLEAEGLEIEPAAEHLHRVVWKRRAP